MHNWFKKLGRVRYMPDDEDVDPFIIRYFLLFKDKANNKNGETENRPGFNIFVHKICKDDPEDMHDHPYSYLTIILRGGYIEETDDGIFHRKPGYIGFYKAEKFHKLKPIKPCWTLFIRGPQRRKWGYRVNGKWMYHLYYQRMKKETV